MEKESRSHAGIALLIIVIVAGVGYAWHRDAIPSVQSASISAMPAATADVPAAAMQTAQADAPAVAPSVPVASHMPMPAAVKAIYVSSWSAGTASSMAHIDSLLAGGVLNSVVIDIKDATGRLSYMPLDPTLAATGVGTRRIANLSRLIQSLHDKGIYVIGRIAVFQDPYRPTVSPDEALQDTTTGGIWKDAGGLLWLRADSPDVWQYTEHIAEDAYAQGFDEINLDYVRFPSDGKLKNIDETAFAKSKQDTIADFFTNMDATLRQQDHIPLSADIFGLTLSASDDMGIGQKLELIARHVDYVCPMIYPSHFAAGTYGFKNPAEHPYDIIHTSLADGIAKLKAANISASKLRPWLQDFNLGAIYTAGMVQAQIDATSDVGLKSWLVWMQRTYTQRPYSNSGILYSLLA